MRDAECDGERGGQFDGAQLQVGECVEALDSYGIWAAANVSERLIVTIALAPNLNAQS